MVTLYLFLLLVASSFQVQTAPGAHNYRAISQLKSQTPVVGDVFINPKQLICYPTAQQCAFFGIRPGEPVVPVKMTNQDGDISIPVESTATQGNKVTFADNPVGWEMRAQYATMQGQLRSGSNISNQ